MTKLSRRRFFTLVTAATAAASLKISKKPMTDTLAAVASDSGGWMLCHGQGLNSSEYPDLYSVIGHMYGGNAQVFHIPDLRNHLISMRDRFVSKHSPQTQLPHFESFMKVRPDKWDTLPVGYIADFLV